MGFMLAMIFSPLIRRPSLEITAAIAQPEGIRIWPSICFMLPTPKKKKNEVCLQRKRTFSTEHPRSTVRIRENDPFCKITICQKITFLRKMIFNKTTVDFRG